MQMRRGEKTSKRREENQQTQPMYDANWELNLCHFGKRPSNPTTALNTR